MWKIDGAEEFLYSSRMGEDGIIIWKYIGACVRYSNGRIRWEQINRIKHVQNRLVVVLLEMNERGLLGL